MWTKLTRQYPEDDTMWELKAGGPVMTLLIKNREWKTFSLEVINTVDCTKLLSEYLPKEITRNRDAKREAVVVLASFCGRLISELRTLEEEL